MNYHLTKRSFTHDEQSQLWSSWSAGNSLSEIGRQINKHAGSVFCFLQKYGGIKPVKPTRKSTALSLSLSEREEISRGLSAHVSIRTIAKDLKRSPSTISREINRHGGILKYRAIAADKQAWINAKRPKACKLSVNSALRTIVENKLTEKWSPEQIAGYLKRLFSGNTAMQISHETIYRTLFIQARGVLKKELQSELRTQRVMRQSRKFNTKGNARGGIIDALPIQDRPKEVEDRAVPGHWEGDLICGANKSYIATLVERTSRFTLLAKLSGNNTDAVIKAITKKMITLPKQLKQTLTWDRGMELAKHKTFTIDTNIKCMSTMTCSRVLKKLNITRKKDLQL